MKEIYLDHSAMTPTDSRVMEAMQTYYTENFGNPLSRHKRGEEANRAVNLAREIIAKLIHASSDEIIFTSTGSESNNLALKGAAIAYQKKGSHLIVSGLEHESTAYSANALQKMGFEITFLAFDKFGLTNPDDVRKAIRKDTTVVAVIHANNEIGTIQPIAEIGKICRERKLIFFSDGVSTVGIIPVNVKELNVDILSFAGNMFYGPAGVAGLYVRQGVRLQSLTDGGRQEKNLRPGTHNLPGIVGLGKAAELVDKEMVRRIEFTKRLRDKLWSGLSKEIDRIYLTGHPTIRLPQHLSFCVEFVEAEALLLLFELEACIAGSSGSICGEETNKASEILLGMGIDEKLARGAIRLTIGKENTEEEIAQVINIAPSLVERLRKKSNAYQKLKSKKVPVPS